MDDGHAIHYTALQPGTPVFSSDETQLGTVREVLDNYAEHIFDGIVMESAGGELRFVDAPEVARTAERAVTLSITAAQAAELPPPERGPPVFKPRGGGRLARLLGGRWKKQ
ncbi:MAG: hypothetical protein H0V50_02535 [Thermoleophilaceae bacterium]|nr:hypothetical protein [Thermoleophilaceae bacterium]